MSVPKGKGAVRTQVTQHLSKPPQHGEYKNVTHRVSRDYGKVGWNPQRLGSLCPIIITSTQVILWYPETLFKLCAFLSVSMGIWINRGKTTVPGSVVPPLCHLPYKFYPLCSCLFLLLRCTALHCLGWGFIQRCGRGRPQSQWHFGNARRYRVQSGECLREHSWGGTAPSCQMLVKNTLMLPNTVGGGPMCEHRGRCY